jgi:hypothetical protein
MHDESFKNLLEHLRKNDREMKKEDMQLKYYPEQQKLSVRLGSMFYYLTREE